MRNGLLILSLLLAGNVFSMQGDTLNLKILQSISLVNIEGQTEKLTVTGKPLMLFVFLSPECPLSQNYTKTINELFASTSSDVSIYGIVPGDAYTVAEVKQFAGKYATAFKLIIDKSYKLTRYLQATVTPQAILLSRKGTRLYTGAIDNWVISLGKKRLQVTEHYLKDAINETLAGRVVVKRTQAIGCKINE